MVQQVIRIIHNDNNRLERLFNLFKSMNSQEYGKLDEKYYCIDSALMFEPRNIEEQLFVFIQRDSMLKGFKTVCYSLKNYKNENNN